jgi:hypothetical protein
MRMDVNEWFKRPSMEHNAARAPVHVQDMAERQRRRQDSPHRHGEEEVREAPPRRRVVYEEVMIGEAPSGGTTAGRQWEGIDMLFAKGVIRLLHKSPFAAGVFFTMALGWCGYMTLHLGWGFTFAWDRQAGLFSYTTDLAKPVQRAAPQGQLHPVARPRTPQPQP